MQTGLLIRILIRVDPDPGGNIFQIYTEKCKEIGYNFKFIQMFKVNLHKLHYSLLLSDFSTLENSS